MYWKPLLYKFLGTTTTNYSRFVSELAGMCTAASALAEMGLEIRNVHTYRSFRMIFGIRILSQNNRSQRGSSFWIHSSLYQTIKKGNIPPASMASNHYS